MAYTLEDEFGDIIGKARRGQHLTLAQTATAAGIPESQLSSMEQYTVKPTEAQVYRLAEVLNLDGAKLLDIAIERWAPNPADLAEHAALDVVTISAPVGGWPVNAYLLICKATDEAAIIDTAAHPSLVLEQLDAREGPTYRDSVDACTQRSHGWTAATPTGHRSSDLHPQERTEAAKRAAAQTDRPR